MGFNPLSWGSSFDPVTFVTDNIQSDIDKNRNISASKELMDYQNKLQNQNWVKQTEYYSPKNVMDRFKAAGLNPHLIYGTGTQSLSAAGNIGTVSTPSSSYKTDSVKNMISSQITAAQIKNLHEQNLNIKEQNKVLAAEAEVKQAQARATQLSNEKMEEEKPYWGQNAFVDSEGKLIENHVRQLERDIKKNEKYISDLSNEFAFDKFTYENNILYQRVQNLSDEDLKILAETSVLYAQKNLISTQGRLNGALATKALSDALLNDSQNFILQYKKNLVKRGIDPDLSPEWRQSIGVLAALLGLSIDADGNVEVRGSGNIRDNVRAIRNRLRYVRR